MSSREIEPSIECKGYGQLTLLTPRGCLAIQVMRHKQFYNPCAECKTGKEVQGMDLGLSGPPQIIEVQVPGKVSVTGWLLARIEDELRTFGPGIKRTLRIRASINRRTLEEEAFYYLQED